MQNIIDEYKCFFVILLIFTAVNLQSNTKNPVRTNNNVLSYCYQPMSSGIPQIYCINADGTNNRKITESSVGLNHQDWSRDTMKYTSVGYIDGGYTTWSIYTFNYNGTGFERLTFVSNVWDTEPAWSPDMTKIAFTRVYPNQNMKNELWVMNADGSCQHYIGIEGFMEKWSVNGMKFIYTAKKNNYNFDIYICDTNGTNEQRLTNTSSDKRFPVYSPDGTEVLFTAGTGNIMTDWEIYKMNSNGQNIRQLTNNNAYEFCPNWSPDGSMIAFGSDVHESGKFEIYTMDTNGANPQRITYSPANMTSVNPVWRHELPNEVKNTNNIVPEKNMLYQNYPNPFNPTTKIRFSIPSNGKRETANVKLIIYDVLGKETANLTPLLRLDCLGSGGKQGLSPGTYEVEWNASGYPSGIYFYRLNSGNFNEAKKMLLIK